MILNNTGNSPRTTLTSTITLSFTMGSGSSGLLVVGVGHKQGAYDLTGITYGGRALTKVREQGRNDYLTELWYLADPPSGTNNIVCTWSGNMIDAVLGAVSFLDVDSDSALDSQNSSSSGSGSISTANTTVAQDCFVVDCGWSDNTGALTVGAGQTQIHQTALANARVGMSYEYSANPAAVTMSWAGPSTDWAHTLAGFKGRSTGSGLFIV